MDEPVLTKKISPRRRASRRQQHHNLILTLAFLLLVVIFTIVNLCVKDRDYSNTENRSLAQSPKFSFEALADGTYFSGLTDHFSDQFFARDGWISLKLREEQLLGRKESGGVFICSQDYLMSSPETPDETAVDASIAAINDFAARYPDTNMHMMLVPAAANILTDYLPKNAPVRDQIGDIQEIGTKLSSTVNFLDATAPLSEHKEEYIYYKTDHHWTSMGAYYTFRSVAQSLGLTVSTEYTPYPVTDSFEGTLSSKSGSHKTTDEISVYAPVDSPVEYYVTYPDGEKSCSIYRSDCLSEKDQYTVFFGGNHSMVEINTTANNGKNLLLFKDSYANCFVQFLIPYYENIIMIDPRYYYDNVNAIMSNYGITDVLYLYSGDTFVTTTALKDVLSSSVQASTTTEATAWETETEPESAIDSTLES